MLTLSAFLKLIEFDPYFAHGNFSAIYERVRNYRRKHRSISRHTPEQICHAVDLASIWYWKPPLCLQRSAAATCLLRRHGLPAEMVVGVRQYPFGAHAWVEVNGQVANDKPYMDEIYAVLVRC